MSSYSTIDNHRSMFFDELRNKYYLDAINKVVNKNSIVLDLGAGLGILGLMALSAGAKKVYLVEPAEIINITKLLIKENDLSDRVECIEGTIEDVELPEKVDVILSVFTGNFLLSEDLLPSLFYARDKFLAPGGTLIPDRAKMFSVPVSAEAYYAKHIDCWSDSLQDVDFSLVRTFSANCVYAYSSKKREAKFLSEPNEILELDFMNAGEAACRNTSEIEILENGKLHGFLGWFDARVGDKWLTTSPEAEQMHWNQVFLPLLKPVDVNRGEKVSCELKRPEFGEWSWVVEAGGKRQKHSTFLSEPINLLKNKKQSRTHKPVISEKGKITQQILELFNGGLSTSDIVIKVQEDHPNLFHTQIEADKFVKNLVEKYT